MDGADKRRDTGEARVVQGANEEAGWKPDFDELSRVAILQTGSLRYEAAHLTLSPLVSILDSAMPKINHIAVLVANLDGAMTLFNRVWGLEPSDIVTLKEQGIRTAAYEFDNIKVELMEPTNPEGAVGRSLEKRGPSIHHMAVEVEDVRGRMQSLKGSGLQFTTEDVSKGLHGSTICFLHPKSTFGILTELVEPAEGAEPAEAA
jgi:methylmalonyl-CoA/ethylmalonyl-CoA epimerase